MGEIVVNSIVAVPTYGLCPKGYILHDGYSGIVADAIRSDVNRGWSGLVPDRAGVETRLLYCAFLPEKITHASIRPIGRTFALDVQEAVNVFCSFPPVYEAVEFHRARHMRVVSENALRMDVFFPDWVFQRALGR